jgi:four helix bundle protein
MRDFKKLIIWEKGMEIALESLTIVNTWPSFEKYSLGNQIVRAAISIPSNIAEGNSRLSEKDKKRFIEIALGSAFELETQVIISQSLSFADKSVLEELMLKIRDEQKQISSFIRLLTKEINAPQAACCKLQATSHKPEA